MSTVDQTRIDAFDDYVRGRLNQAEREQFEIWLLENPEVLPQLRLHEAMCRGMQGQVQQAAPESSELQSDEAPERGSTAAVPRWLGWLTTPKFAGGVAAACIVLAVATGGLYLDERNERAEYQQALELERQPQTVLARIPLIKTRSGGTAPNATVHVGSSSGTVLLELSARPWMTEVSTVDVNLTGAGVSTSLNAVAIKPDGTVTIGVSAGALQQGIMSLEMRAQGQSLTTYRVQVVRDK